VVHAQNVKGANGEKQIAQACGKHFFADSEKQWLKLNVEG
jgi:hypothetical protein